MPPYELGASVSERAAPRFDWLVLQVTINVLGKLFDRDVATMRLLLQGHQYDVVQIAA
jgi:hypothetical protein